MPSVTTRLAIIALLAATTVARAQAPRMKLKPADAKLEEEFTALGSVRELSDGRVLLNDSRENRIVVADFKTGVVTQIGRKGQGPGEYGTAVPIRALSGDSSIMMDIIGRRWLLLDGAAIVATVPPTSPIVQAMSGIATSADGRGRVWKTLSPPRLGLGGENPAPGVREIGAADSGFLVVGSRATGKIDTIVKLRAAPTRMSIINGPDGKVQSASITRPLLTVGEDAVLFADGWFAVVRLDPYRVDWIDPSGKITKGAPVATEHLAITTEERDAFTARQAAANPGPQRSASGRAVLPLLPATGGPPLEFPDFFPPYAANGLIAGEDGNVWIRKPLTKDNPDARYDVVDRRGRLVGTLSLAKGERLLGVTKKAIYVVWKDDDDIERLRRHPR